MATIISPSLLAADFTDLRHEVEMINKSDADWLHLDIMDGTFVPNISFGFPVIDAVAKICKKPLDVHFMIEHPERYVQRTAKTGAMMMNVHYEACVHLHRTVQEIHDAGMKAGVTLNPSTPVCLLEDILNDVDMVLLMSVNPGFGGQSFIPGTIAKLHELTAMCERHGVSPMIEVDGGISSKNIAEVVKAGANVLVAGSAVFKSEDPAAEVALLQKLGNEAAQEA